MCSVADIKDAAELRNDLLISMINYSAAGKKDSKNSAPWLKKLLNAFDDCVNDDLYQDSSVTPVMLQHCEPW